MNRARFALALVLALGLWSKMALADGVAIQVSPNVINIASASTVVTVHTDLPYHLVDGASVTLNGLEISWWKSDDRGYFVAKFSSGEVKALEEVAEAGAAGTSVTLTIAGTCGGEPFSGSDDVKVIDVSGKKK